MGKSQHKLKVVEEPDESILLDPLDQEEEDLNQLEDRTIVFDEDMLQD